MQVTSSKSQTSAIQKSQPVQQAIFTNHPAMFQFFEANEPKSSFKSHGKDAIQTALSDTLDQVNNEFETLSSVEIDANNAEDVLLKSTALLNILDNIPKHLLSSKETSSSIDKLYIQIETLALNASHVHYSGEEQYTKAVQSKKLKPDDSPARLKYQAMLDSFKPQAHNLTSPASNPVTTESRQVLPNLSTEKNEIELSHSPVESKELLSSSNDILSPDSKWKIISTSGHNNNCGIFSMYPQISQQQANEKRSELVNELIVAYEQNQFTDDDYHAMQVNLRTSRNLREIDVNDPNQQKTLSSIFHDYLEGILNNTFLDPFALQFLAKKDNKHIIFIEHQNFSEVQFKTLEEIWLSDHTSAQQVYNLDDVIFIAHNGVNHFERILLK